MKNIISRILFLILIFFIPATAMSQPGNAQLIETVNTIKKQIADLEKQIDSLKNSKADPRKIKNKQDQLEALKNMSKMINTPGSNAGTNTPSNISGKIPAQANDSLKAKYISPITLVKITKPYTKPTQAEATARFMGFKGKKLDKYTLVTASGKLVQLNPQQNKLIIQTDSVKDIFIKIVSKLSKTAEAKNEMVGEVNSIKNCFFYYPELVKVYSEFDYITENFTSVVGNTISLPPVPGNTPISNSNPQQNPAPAETGNGNNETILKLYNDFIAREYQQLMQLLNNPPPVDNFSAPPKREYDLCFDCDTIKLKEYYKAVRIWDSTLKIYEYELIRKYFSINRASALMGGDGSTGNPEWDANINKAFGFARTRLEKKTQLLLQRYKKDVHYHTPLLQNVLGLSRQNQLLGSEGEGSNAGEEMHSFFEILEKYIREEMTKYNYSIVMNFSLLLGLERQYQLLGAFNEESNLLNDVIKFNRFALNLYMDFDFTSKNFDNGDITLQATGSVEVDRTNGPLYVSIGQGKCTWYLYLTDGDYINPGNTASLVIPLHYLNGTRKMKVNNEWQTTNYAGPKQMEMGLPASRINFCKDGKQDSLFLEPIRYSPGNIVNAKSVATTYSYDFAVYLNRMISSVSKTEGNKEKMTDLAKKIPSSRPPTRRTGNAQLDEMQKMYEGKMQTMEFQKQLSQMANQSETVLLFDAINFSNVLINKTSDINYSDNKKENIKGKIFLSAIHSPVTN